MTVSSITRELAEAILAARPSPTPRQRLLIELLCLLPLYEEIGNVATWDKAYHDAMPREDNTSEIDRLIEAVYDFATVPFYGAFEAEVALSAYESTCRFLRSEGITCPAVDGYTDLRPRCLTSRRSQQPIAHSVSRKSVGFTTPPFGCGSAFFVRRFGIWSTGGLRTRWSATPSTRWVSVVTQNRRHTNALIGVRFPAQFTCL